MKKLFKMVVFIIFGGMVLLLQGTVKSQEEAKLGYADFQVETLTDDNPNDLTKVGFPEWIERH